MAAFPVDAVDDGSARSVQGPTVGFCDATVTSTEERVDLTLYGGRYVTIYFEGDDGYIAFAATNVATIVVTAQAMGTVGVPLRVYQGVPAHVVVPKAAPFLCFRSVGAGGTVVIRVLPS